MLENFKLLASDVTSFQFNIIKRPSQADGFYIYSVSPLDEVVCTENDLGIEIINEAKVIGYIGISPEDEADLNGDDKVFELYLKFRCVYSIPKKEQVENILQESRWFFEPQSRLFSKQVIQNFLSNTEYRNISVPLQHDG